MTRNSEMDGTQAPQQKSESFMEPRTIPKNWDVSAFETPEFSPTDGSFESGEPTLSEEGGSSDGDETKANFDPFPQPRTVPGNWEVSDLV
jgi:hypothetical protein